MFLKSAHLLQCQRCIECRLPAHGRQQGIGFFDRDNFLNDFWGDRLDICRIGHARIRHDCRWIGVHQNNAIALIAKGLAGLNTRIVKLTSLADNDRSRPDNKDRGNIGTFRHENQLFFGRESKLSRHNETGS